MAYQGERWSRGCGTGIGLSGHKNQFRQGVTIENWVEDDHARHDAINGNNLYGKHGAKFDALTTAQADFTEAGKTGAELLEIASRQDLENTYVGQDREHIFPHGLAGQPNGFYDHSLNDLTYAYPGENPKMKVQQYMWAGSKFNDTKVPHGGDRTSLAAAKKAQAAAEALQEAAAAAARAAEQQQEEERLAEQLKQAERLAEVGPSAPRFAVGAGLVLVVHDDDANLHKGTSVHCLGVGPVSPGGVCQHPQHPTVFAQHRNDKVIVYDCLDEPVKVRAALHIGDERVLGLQFLAQRSGDIVLALVVEARGREGRVGLFVLLAHVKHAKATVHEAQCLSDTLQVDGLVTLAASKDGEQLCVGGRGLLKLFRVRALRLEPLPEAFFFEHHPLVQGFKIEALTIADASKGRFAVCALSHGALLLIALDDDRADRARSELVERALDAPVERLLAQPDAFLAVGRRGASLVSLREASWLEAREVDPCLAQAEADGTTAWLSWR